MTITQSSAEVLRNFIKESWSLTGELSKEIEGTMDEVVQFYDHKQVRGNEATKAVVVEKINPEGDEKLTENPHFTEVIDTYDILVRYRVVDVDPDRYDDSLGYIEQMGQEVVNILQTKYDPFTNAGVYYRSSNEWSNEDVHKGNQHDLKRRLRFELTAVTSDDPDVYTGVGGTLVLSTASTGDDIPSSDVTYIYVDEIKVSEGFSQIPTLTKDVSNGVGVPLFMRGQFSGSFSAKMYVNKDTVIGNDLDALQNLYRLQTESALIGQNADVVLLRNNVNVQRVTTATAVVLAVDGTGAVTSVGITDEAGFYGSNPIVTVNNGDATITAEVIDGKVKTLTITSGGTTNILGTTTLSIAAPSTTVSTLTRQTFLKISPLDENVSDTALLHYTIHGTLTKPSVFSESAA